MRCFRFTAICGSRFLFLSEHHRRGGWRSPAFSSSLQREAETAPNNDHMDKTELFQEISDNVVDMDDEAVEELCEQSLSEGIDPSETIQEGLIAGMNRVSELFESEEYFLPEVMTASYAMNAGIDILKPHIKQDKASAPISIVIGVVEGDTHDIGKNLVKIMCEAAGFKVYDLGRDVPLNQFVDTAEEKHCDVICMSTLMTTTMEGMRTVVNTLKKRGIRGKYKVMIGGGPISQKFADMIGADAYSPNAHAAVLQIKEMMGVE